MLLINEILLQMLILNVSLNQHSHYSNIYYTTIHYFTVDSIAKSTTNVDPINNKNWMRTFDFVDLEYGKHLMLPIVSCYYNLLLHTRLLFT